MKDYFFVVKDLRLFSLETFCVLLISFLKDFVQYLSAVMQFGRLCKCLQGIPRKNEFAVCYLG